METLPLEIKDEPTLGSKPRTVINLEIGVYRVHVTTIGSLNMVRQKVFLSRKKRTRVHDKREVQPRETGP